MTGVEDTTMFVTKDMLHAFKVLKAVTNKTTKDLLKEMMEEYAKKHSIKVPGFF